MTCPLSSPLSVSKWVCGGGACDINGDFCCGSTLIPRSKRSNEFQATIQVLEAAIALGQQNLPRTAENIVSASMQLHPEETEITESILLAAIDAGRRNALLCFDRQTLEYASNAFNAATRVKLFPYLPFIQAFSPFKVKYPPLVV